ncbi:MAG: hypothetical protein IJM59_10790 [Proteobacteria bacterium]|nr:hypothetical protein [Pseudomonadota bacterium]
MHQFKFQCDYKYYIIRICTILLTMMTIAGCATEQSLESSRIRNWPFAQSGTQTPKATFIPKGLYITGLTGNNSFAPDTWVRIVPGQQWPAEEPRPTLFVGRVAERQKTSARIELLALQEGIREHNPGFEVYEMTPNIAQSLHAITKRLVFPAAIPDGDEIITTYSDTENVIGNELYAAVDVSRPSSGQRLAAQATALMKAMPDTAGAMHLTKISGHVPQNAAFVLLDAPMEPAFDVRIQIASGNNQQAIESKIKQLLSGNLPGMDHIRIAQSPKTLNLNDAILSLGSVQTDTLEIIITSFDKQIAMADQGLRVTDSPWTVVLDDDDPEPAAIAAVSRALEMLGYPASNAWMLEQFMAGTDSVTRKAALAPALAAAYQTIGRGDWAFEIALELKGYTSTASKKNKLRLLASIAAILSMSGRTSEFPNFFDEINAGLSSLSSPWKRLFAHAAAKADNLPKAKEYFRAAKHAYWTEYDQMLACAALADEEECQEGIEQSKTEIGRLWFRIFSPQIVEKTAKLLELANRIDEIGAPYPAYHLWFDRISETAQDDPGKTLLRNTALYARKAQNNRLYLSMMMHYLLNQPFDSESSGEVIKELTALDLREDIAELCMSGALTGTLDESIHLLSAAVELYLSIGDAENAAIALARLSRKYTEAGQESKAAEYMNRAQKFGRDSRQKEVLQALRGDSEIAEQ